MNGETAVHVTESDKEDVLDAVRRGFPAQRRPPCPPPFRNSPDSEVGDDAARASLIRCRLGERIIALQAYFARPPAGLEWQEQLRQRRGKLAWSGAAVASRGGSPATAASIWVLDPSPYASGIAEATARGRSTITLAFRGPCPTAMVP